MFVWKMYYYSYASVILQDSKGGTYITRLVEISLSSTPCISPIHASFISSYHLLVLGLVMMKRYIVLCPTQASPRVLLLKRQSCA